MLKRLTAIGAKTFKATNDSYGMISISQRVCSNVSELTSSFLTVEVFGEDKNGNKIDVAIKVPWMLFPNRTTTAYDAVVHAVLFDHENLHTFDASFYGTNPSFPSAGPLGYEFDSFNNVKEDPKDQYWKLSVDGVVSDHYGPSFYILSSFGKDFGNTSVRYELTDFPKENEFHVHCAGGYRSVIAASILKARGYHNIVDVAGGYGAIKKTGIVLE